MRAFFLVVLSVLIAGCSPDKFPENLLTQQERMLIRGAVDDVSRGDAARLSAKVQPEIATQISGAMPAMQGGLPDPPLELSALNTNVSVSGGTRIANAVYQAKGRSGWALIEATVQTTGQRSQLTGFYVESAKAEPRTLNNFRLSDAGPAGWAMLGAMLAAAAIKIAAIVHIWRSGLFERRWLWIIGALIGFTTLRLNWSTNEFSFQPISVQLFSLSASKSPVFAPWILGVSLPVVALLALFRRRGRDHQEVQTEN